MSEITTAATRCSRCGTRIEECACCDESDCGAAICYGCLNVAVGQEMPSHTPTAGSAGRPGAGP